MNTHVELFEKALKRFNVKQEKISKLCCDLEKMIQNRESPQTYWNLIAYGAYKECYDVGEHIVVKFAAEDNRTEEEHKVIILAGLEGLKKTFLPSIFIPLDNDILPIKYIEEDFSHSVWTWDAEKMMCKKRHQKGIKFNYMIIQEKIAYTERREASTKYEDDHYTKDNYYKEPLINESGAIIPYESIRDASLSNKNWLNNLIKKFGSSYMDTLLKFIENNDLSDLHDGNIGYLYDGTPVIIDWI